jgi:integrase
MFDAIIERNPGIVAARHSGDPELRASVKGLRVVSNATLHRIRATLRKSLNDAIRAHRLIEFNPAAHIELPSEKRPKARVWTAAAITAWQHTGVKPSPVMVWTPAQAGAFLDHAETHDIVLYPLFLLILHRGLRRGEAVGLRDADVDLDTGTLTIAQQITTVGWTPVTKTVKSDAGDRTIPLDTVSLTALRAYHARRARWRLVNGPSWASTGLFFVQPTGIAYHPETVSTRFEQLVADAGLPPIRLHDLRHCAATYLKASGADLKDIQETPRPLIHHHHQRHLHQRRARVDHRTRQGQRRSRPGSSRVAPIGLKTGPDQHRRNTPRLLACSAAKGQNPTKRPCSADYTEE